MEDIIKAAQAILRAQRALNAGQLVTQLAAAGIFTTPVWLAKYFPPDDRGIYLARDFV